MPSPTRTRLFLPLVVAALLAGCGGGSQGSQNASSPATAGPTTEGQTEQRALPLANAAPVPKDIGCAMSDVVWVNLKTKSYHESDDPYFGRTKNGQYMCKEAADSAGYHMAGSKHARRSRDMGGSNGSAPSDNSTPSDSGT